MSDLWIVVVNFNGLQDTLKCLRSLEAVRSPHTFVVLVDNASIEDPTAAIREQFPWCPVVRNAVNGGWAGGNNTGIRFALDRGAEQVVLLNNDTEVAPQLVKRLTEAAATHTDYGIVGPVINFLEERDAVMTDGCLFNHPGYEGFFQRRPVSLTPNDAPELTEVDIVNGCCMMISRRVFERIGLIDERFFLIHEESDFCLRARRAGFRCGVLGEVLVWHKGSSSFKRTGKRFQRYYDARNLSLLLTKNQAGHAAGRGAWQSRFHYLKYVYYRYAIEREAGHADAAEGVLEGVHDALVRRFGAYAGEPRLTLPLVRGLFDLWFHYRSGRAEKKEASRIAFTLR
jgi:GT2 family glycosyltransferase